MSTSGRVIKNTIYLYVKSIVSMIVMLYVTRVVLQTLGVVDYGIYNVVAGSIAILGFFRNSLSITMQRFLNHYQGENSFEGQKQAFNIGIVFHWAVAIVLVVLFALFAFLLFNGILNIPEDRVGAAKIVYLCLIVNTFLTVITAPYEATITAHENMLFYSVVGIVDVFLKLIVALMLNIVNGDKLIYYAALMMIIPFIETTTMRIYCKMKYSECVFSPRKEWNGSMAKEMMKFAGWTMVGATTNIVSNHGANLALNHYFGAAINAVAGIANQIQGVIAVLLNGLLKSLTPVIFKREGAGNISSMLRISLFGCKYSTYLFSLLAVPVFIYTPFLLKIWLVEVPEWCVLFVRLQLLRSFVEQLCGSLQSSLNATNHVREFNILSCIYNLAPIVVLIVLYSLGFGPYWHYIVMIIVMTMGANITLLLLCKKYCGLSIVYFLKQVLIPSLVTVLAAFIISVVASFVNTSWFGLVLCLLLSSSVFVLLFWLFATYEEKQMIKGFLYRIKNRNNAQNLTN